MTSNRNYRLALSTDEARRRLHEGAGTQFDPDIVVAFERAYGIGMMDSLSEGNGATASDADDADDADDANDANHANDARELACPKVA